MKENNQEINVKVIEAIPDSSISDIPQILLSKKIANPQCIIKYGGQDGLTVRSRDFYKNNFFKIISYLFKAKPYTIWSQDLYAWKGLSDPFVSLESATCKAIDNTLPDDPHYLILHSSSFFKSLKNFTPAEENLFINILQRNFLWKWSDKFEPKGITGKNIKLPEWLGETLLQKDTMQLQGALQYLEILWLMREVVREQISLSNLHTVNIALILPGGKEPEIAYYLDNTHNPTDLFALDIQKLLATDGNPEMGKTVNIYFFGFLYEPPQELISARDALKANLPYVFFDGDMLVKNNESLAW